MSSFEPLFDQAGRPNRALACLTALALSAVALAGVERDLAEKTTHRYISNSPESTIDTLTDQGYRLFDIEVTGTSPLRYGGSFVKNTGPYQSAWWWTANKTKAQFIEYYTSRGARVLDLEVYRVNGEKRYAGTFVPSSNRAGTWMWFEDLTFQQMLDQADSKGMRITDLDFETISGVRKFSGVMIRNAGAEHKDWVAFSNLTSDEIKEKMSARSMRIVDIERISDTRFAGVLQEREGQATWYFTNRTWETVQWLQDQYGSRIIDIERHTVGKDVRFNVLLINNANDLEWTIGQMLRAGSDGTRGFILKQVNGPILGELMPTFRTYPASTIKVLEHYYWSRRIGNGMSPQTLVPIYTNHTSDTHVQSDVATNQSLQLTMQQMMRPSNNQSANALQEFAGNGNGATGRTNINNFAYNTLGLTDDIKLNHKFANGNVANDPYNIMTMRQIAALYENFAESTALNPVGWNFFHDNMLNEIGTGGSQFGNGVLVVMQQEGAAIGMTNAEVNQVFNQIVLCWKPGNVTGYNSTAGWIRVPYKTVRGTVFKEFVLAAFQDDFTNNPLGNLSGTVMPEILRGELADALLTWN
ncbi:MAG: serine hydrolase [Fimbriimonadaceae bacterium]